MPSNTLKVYIFFIFVIFYIVLVLKTEKNMIFIKKDEKSVDHHIYI